jgi:hypothetical protein
LRLVKRIVYEEKFPIIFHPDRKDDNISVYVHDKNKIMKKDVFDRYRKRPLDVKGILVVAEDKKKTLKENYETFIEEADALKEATNGVINKYKTGRSSKTALDLFYKFVETLKVDPISDYEEALWIHKASSGSIMYAEKYSGPAYSYDFVSHYGFIMQDHHMLFPIKSGEFMTLTQKEFKTKKFVSYGIYRCKIKSSLNINKNKLFRFSRTDYYTHIDINSAIQENFEIKMIEDGKPNMLYYSRDCLIQGHLLFKPYIDYLFDLKQKKVPGSKKIQNSTWGVLSQANIITIEFDIHEGFNYEGKNFIELIPNQNNPDKMKVKMVDKKNFLKQILPESNYLF